MKRRRIDKRKADPEILRDYEDLRNERRRGWLMNMTLFLRAFGYFSIFLVAFALPEEHRITGLYVWFCVVGVLLFFQYRSIIMWQPHGERARVAKLVGAYLAGMAAAGVVIMLIFHVIITRLAS